MYEKPHAVSALPTVCSPCCPPGTGSGLACRTGCCPPPQAASSCGMQQQEALQKAHEQVRKQQEHLAAIEHALNAGCLMYCTIRKLQSHRSSCRTAGPQCACCPHLNSCCQLSVLHATTKPSSDADSSQGRPAAGATQCAPAAKRPSEHSLSSRPPCCSCHTCRDSSRASRPITAQPPIGRNEHAAQARSYMQFTRSCKNCSLCSYSRAFTAAGLQQCRCGVEHTQLLRTAMVGSRAAVTSCCWPARKAMLTSGCCARPRQLYSRAPLAAS